MKSLDFLNSIKSSIEDNETVDYFINGDKFKLEYKNKKYVISNLNKKQNFQDISQYKKSLLARLVSINIPTQNPASITINFVLNFEMKAIQVLDISTNSSSLQTKKILVKHLREFSKIEYGDITIFSKLANFNYNYFSSLDFSEAQNEDELNSFLCDSIFFKCNHLLDREIFKIGIAKIGERFKVREEDGRLQRVY